MILSALSTFSDNQAITASADSTNVIDLGVAGTPYGAAAALNKDIGKGSKIPILIQVTESFNNLTSLEIKISTGTASTLGTTVVSKVVPLASLVKGYQFPVDVLPETINQRYLGIEYVVVGTAPTTGKITAAITMGNQSNVTGA